MEDVVHYERSTDNFPTDSDRYSSLFYGMANRDLTVLRKWEISPCRFHGRRGVMYVTLEYFTPRFPRVAREVGA